MTRQLLLRIPVVGLVALAAACATKPHDPVDYFSGPLTPTAVYAIDNRQSSAANQSAGAGTIPEFLVWASDGRPQTATPPNYFTRFRIEFNQPVDGTTVSAKDLDLTSSALTNVATYSWCTPAGTTTKSVQLIDVDDTVTPSRGVPASVCYEPGQKVGSNPGIVVVAGTGTLANGATAAPLTCQTFTASGATENFAVNHKYALKLDAGLKAAYGGAFQSPSGGGWSSGTFTFTTDDFRILGIGYQNGVTGFYSWAEKLAGFHYFSPATPFDQQIDCDQTAADSSQKPCRIPPDGSGIEIMFTQTLSAASLAGNVTLTRKGATDDPDSYYAPIRGSRSLLVGMGLRFEPNTEYTITLKAGIKGTGSATTLGADKVINFKAASGATLASAKTIKLLSISPDNGTTGNPLGTPGIALQFTYPVDISGATITIKDPSGATISGPAATADGSAKQEVDIPITGTLTPDTKYTLSATGLKVSNEAGLPSGVGNQPYDAISSSFVTERFTLTHLVDSSGATYDVDYGNIIPPSLILTQMSALFTVATDPATVTSTSLTVTENGTAVSGFTITPSADKTTYQLTPPSGFKPKYGAAYRVTAAGAGGSGSPIKSLDGKYTVKAENCQTGDCSQAVSFTTSGFAGAISVTDRALGKFRVTFPAPGIDGTQIQDFLATGGKMFAIYPQTLVIDPNNGLHTFNTNTAAPIAVTCTLNSPTNTQVNCAPTSGTALPANSYFLASARFFKSKTADGGPGIPNTTTVDAASGLYSGSLARTFVTPCP